MKPLLLQIHWLLGLVGGPVLAVAGITGAMLSFEAEITAALNPGVVTVVQRDAAPLSPPDLLAAVARDNPQRRVTSVEIDFAGNRTPRVGFAPLPDPTGAAPNRRIEWRYADPYSAQLLGAPAGEAFFRTTRDLHRYLAAGDVGKQIVGASTAALLLLVASGIYLRWPRNARSWRALLSIDWGLRGRAFFYRLHAVVGTLVLPVYLAIALTGLTWSYEWYRGASYWVLGAGGPPRTATPTIAAAPNDAERPDAVATFRSIWPTLASVSTQAQPPWCCCRTRAEIRSKFATSTRTRRTNARAIDSSSTRRPDNRRFQSAMQTNQSARASPPASLRCIAEVTSA